MQYVLNVKALVPVRVYTIILETLTLVADQNAFRIPIAIDQKHVSTISAKIHVQEFVDSMQNAGCKIIRLFVYA